MQTTSAGQRESPVTSTNCTRRSRSRTAATSPGDNVNRSLSATVGPATLSSHQAVADRRHTTTNAARTTARRAESVPAPLRLVHKGKRIVAIAYSMSNINSENTRETWSRETRADADVHVRLRIWKQPLAGPRRVDERRGA